MNEPRSKTTPARMAADALLNAGLIRVDSLDAVAAVISANTPKNAGSYNFSGDSEFLHTCLNHHLDSYFSQVLEPLVLTYRSVQKTGGRLISDTDIDKASLELTTEVMNEIGKEYRNYMYRYFSDDLGMTSYIYTRVFDSLIATARKFNDDYLTALNTTLRTKKVINTLATETQGG